MADIPALERLLKEIEALEGVQEALLVGRSGFHIAGGVPKDVNSETFVAMFAILLGAANEAADTLKERLESAVIFTEGSKVLIVPNGPKALFVVRVKKVVDTGPLREAIRSYAAKTEQHL